MTNVNNQLIRFAYFGGEPLGVPVLERLQAAGLTPSLVVASPDRPAGRKLVLTPPPVKVWAEANCIPVFQPTSLKNQDELEPLTEGNFNLFVVVAYNKMLPTWLLELPTYKTINLHPSLLPHYRGASPIRTAILEDNPAAVGVTIMLMDAEMDHGPILTQEIHEIDPATWPIHGDALDTALAVHGGELLAATIPAYIAGELAPQEQDHAQATYTRKITKADGELMINPLDLPTGTAARAALCKIRAFAGWPGTFFMHESKRIKILDATLDEQAQLVITEVVPEGKKPQSFAQFIANHT